MSLTDFKNVHFSTVTAFESPVSKQKVLPVLPAGHYYRKTSPNCLDWFFVIIIKGVYVLGAGYLKIA